MTLARSATLHNFRHCVEGLGGDALEYAWLAGLPPGALDSDLLVDGRPVAAVLEIAAAKLGRPDLGLRVGAAQELGMPGALAVAIRNSSSVADAMERISRYMFVHGPELSLSVLADPDRLPGVVVLRYSCGAGREPLPQAVDMTMLFIHRMTAFLVGDRYTPHTVDLPHRPAASPETYSEAFGVPVRFARTHADLRVPAWPAVTAPEERGRGPCGGGRCGCCPAGSGNRAPRRRTGCAPYSGSPSTWAGRPCPRWHASCRSTPELCNGDSPRRDGRSRRSSTTPAATGPGAT